jgi:hypothetical protein
MLRFLCGTLVPPTIWVLWWLLSSLPRAAEDSAHAVAYITAIFFWVVAIFGLLALAYWNRGRGHG